MKELGINLGKVQAFFSEVHQKPFILVKIAPEKTAEWTQMLGVPARRCYISDTRLRDSVQRTKESYEAVVESTLPDRGSVMAGDYGEIITALYLASLEYPANILDPKKWRLKDRRTAAAGFSDVVQFQLPKWPDASSDDKLVCAEVKTKSTNGRSTPVQSAIEDSRKDRRSRLAKTLVWLRERALKEDLGTVEIVHLDRFIKAIDHPSSTYEFRAVAVISSELIDNELLDVTFPDQDDCTLVVISFPELKANYESLYSEVLANATEAV